MCVCVCVCVWHCRAYERTQGTQGDHVLSDLTKRVMNPLTPLEFDAVVNGRRNKRDRKGRAERNVSDHRPPPPIPTPPPPNTHAPRCASACHPRCMQPKGLPYLSSCVQTPGSLGFFRL